MDLLRIESVYPDKMQTSAADFVNITLANIKASSIGLALSRIVSTSQSHE